MLIKAGDASRHVTRGDDQAKGGRGRILVDRLPVIELLRRTLC